MNVYDGRLNRGPETGRMGQKTLISQIMTRNIAYGSDVAVTIQARK